jgi:hypothetical protein
VLRFFWVGGGTNSDIFRIDTLLCYFLCKSLLTYIYNLVELRTRRVLNQGLSGPTSDYTKRAQYTGYSPNRAARWPAYGVRPVAARVRDETPRMRVHEWVRTVTDCSRAWRNTVRTLASRACNVDTTLVPRSKLEHNVHYTALKTWQNMIQYRQHIWHK